MHIRTCSYHPLTIRLWAVILVFAIFPLVLKADYRLEGQINISAKWSPTIYLSAINSFEDRNVASEDFVINMARINQDGTFLLSGANLPKEDRLYRLHICKEEDPVSTIIIGGKEENHLHFVMNNASKITLVTAPNSFLFQDYTINNIGSILLQQLDDLQSFWQQKKTISTPTSREYNDLQLQNQLRLFADTCSHPLLSLFALYQIDPAIDYPENYLFYHNLLAKWQETQAKYPYFQAYEQQLAYLDFLHFNNSSFRFMEQWKWIIGFLLLLLISSLFVYRSFFKQKKRVKKPLSVQERKVFQLLKAGKSNKEISSELNIGIATVKTHIYKIYNKTGIRSRKELMQE